MRLSAQGHGRSRRLLLPQNRSKFASLDCFPPECYEKQLREDEPGLELDEDARVWKVYLEEARKFDYDLTNRWRDDLDMLLVFAGLFSAAVIAFVAQFYQDTFQPEYSQMLVTLLAHSMNQGLLAQGREPIQIDPSLSLEDIANHPSPGKLKVAVMVLWFVSLVLSLGTALLCVLVKQWLDFYTTTISAPPRMLALLRHHRFLGLKKWGVGAFVHALPYVFAIAVLLFLFGVIIFIAPSSVVLAGSVTSAGAAFTVFYITSLVLPLCSPDCPFVSPATMFFLWVGHAFGTHSERRQQTQSRIFSFGQHFVPHEVIFRLLEEKLVKDEKVDLAAHALAWLAAACGERDPSINSVIIQSLGGNCTRGDTTDTQDDKKDGKESIQPQGNASENEKGAHQDVNSTAPKVAQGHPTKFHETLLEISTFHTEALRALGDFLETAHSQPPSDQPPTAAEKKLPRDIINADPRAKRLLQTCDAFAKVHEDTRVKLDTMLNPSASFAAQIVAEPSSMLTTRDDDQGVDSIKKLGSDPPDTAIPPTPTPPYRIMSTATPQTTSPNLPKGLV